MLNPLEEKILRYLIEHKNEGEFVSIKLPDESLADVCMATKCERCLYFTFSFCMFNPRWKILFQYGRKKKLKGKKILSSADCD